MKKALIITASGLAVIGIIASLGIIYARRSFKNFKITDTDFGLDSVSI